MKHMIGPGILASLVVLIPVFLAGCGGADRGTPKADPIPATDHDHDPDRSGTDDHDHPHAHAHADAHAHELPRDFQAAVAALQVQYRQIKEALEQGDVDAAHEPLHAVGMLLESLPGLADAAQLSESDVTAVVNAVNTMFECYGALDHAAHEGEKADYSSVGSRLEESMRKIEETLSKSAGP